MIETLVSPKIGDIKHKGTNYFVWHACVDCGKERWVKRQYGSPAHLRCSLCSFKRLVGNQYGSLNPVWKGGQKLEHGYIYILKHEHPNANPKGYIKRARLVLEEKLGRYLLPSEHSHHINGIKDDDRPENLMALSNSEHGKLNPVIIRRSSTLTTE